MKTYHLSDEDAEYIEFLIDNTLGRNLDKANQIADWVESAHSEYNLGKLSKTVDKMFLEAHREGLLFLINLKNRFVPAEVDNDEEPV